MIRKALIGIVAGFLSHFIFYDLTGKYTHPADMYRSGAGVLTTLPIFALFRREDTNKTGVLAFVSAFVSVGLGVVLARLAREMWNSWR